MEKKEKNVKLTMSSSHTRNASACSNCLTGRQHIKFSWDSEPIKFLSRRLLIENWFNQKNRHPSQKHPQRLLKTFSTGGSQNVLWSGTYRALKSTAQRNGLVVLGRGMGLENRVEKEGLLIPWCNAVVLSPALCCLLRSSTLSAKLL